MFLTEYLYLFRSKKKWILGVDKTEKLTTTQKTESKFEREWKTSAMYGSPFLPAKKD